MIRIGIIGGGTITRRRHLPEIAGNPDAQVGAVCDTLEERAVKLCREYGGTPYTDYKKLLADPSLDAVIVAATNTTHAAMTIDALRAGRHVMCEKPMATSLEEAQAMIDAAEAAGKMLFIAQNQRLAPAHIKAKAILDSGMLGKVITFKSTFGHPGSEYWAEEKGRTWFYKKAISVYGCLGDLGIHKIDQLRWMLNDEFTDVFAMVETLNKHNADGELIDVEDNATMLLKTQKGATGTITVSWTYEKEDISSVFYCEKGVMTVYGPTQYPITIERNDGTADYYKVGEIPSNIVQVKTGIIDEFVNCITENRPASISGRDGMEPLKVVFAAYESAKKKQLIKI